MSYTFVYNQKDGWWLKITKIEELMSYWEHYTNMFEESVARLPQTKEFGRGMQHANNIDTLIGFYAKSHKILFEDAKTEILCDIKKEQYKALNEKGVIYINKKHGWNSVVRETEQFVHRNELVFPDFQKGKIKIERFPLGNHYYVFLDDVQLRDGDKLKWNSPEEANEFAEKVRGGQNIE